uniref:Hypothetical_protein n=1 Tax=Oryza glaberrima TaxID=4538 RepID=G2XLI1_ORYGL|nr:hypothetical_protein [Oryza glaberrima]
MTTTATSLSLLAPSASASSTRACPPTPPASIVSQRAAMDDDGGILPLPVGAIRLRLVLLRLPSHAAAVEARAPDLQRAASSRGATARHPRAGRVPAGRARVWRWWAAMAYRTSPTVSPHLAGLLPTSRPTSAELACADLVDRGDFNGARRVVDAMLAAAGPRGEVSDRLTREAMAALDRDVLLCCTDDRARHTILPRPGCSSPAIDVERRGERK